MHRAARLPTQRVPGFMVQCASSPCAGYFFWFDDQRRGSGRLPNRTFSIAFRRLPLGGCARFAYYWGILMLQWQQILVPSASSRSVFSGSGYGYCPTAGNWNPLALGVYQPALRTYHGRICIFFPSGIFTAPQRMAGSTLFSDGRIGRPLKNLPGATLRGRRPTGGHDGHGIGRCFLSPVLSRCSFESLGRRKMALELIDTWVAKVREYPSKYASFWGNSC